MTKTVSDGDSALSERIDSLDAAYKAADNTTNANLSNLEKTVADANGALAEQISNLDAAYKAADVATNAALSELDQVTSSADEALAQQITNMGATVAEGDLKNSALLHALSQTVANAAKVMAMQIQQLNAAYGAVSEGETAVSDAKFTETRKALADAEQSLVEQITHLDSTFNSELGQTNAALTSLQQTVSDNNSSMSQRVDTVEAKAESADKKGDDAKAAAQTNSQAIATINQDGSTAFQALWSTKAQAGDITAGIGIVAKSDGTSQVAVSASQFFVYDPNKPGTLTPTFVIDNGSVTIPTALIEKATIQILNAQTIVADSVKVGIEITSPSIEGGEFRGGDAGFGLGGSYSGYYTFIEKDGTIKTSRLQLKSSTEGNRLEIDSDVIKVYEGGMIRVKIGNLSK